MKPSDIQLLRIYTLVQAQFQGLSSTTVGHLLGEIDIEVSRKTQRIRYIFDIFGKDKTLLLSLRTNDGRLIPSFEFGERLIKTGYSRNSVVIQNEVRSFISEGKSAFCKHVVGVGDNIFPRSEVFVVDENNKLLATGTAIQPGYAMLELESGLAVKPGKSRAKSKINS
ncbi:MAG: hypothetical protein IH840_14845 [Candidatus Heimdallarchaeota archaeon]|nr:hypothetical protein [Candidatus Heimdallarchaeota archaeon]